MMEKRMKITSVSVTDRAGNGRGVRHLQKGLPTSPFTMAGTGAAHIVTLIKEDQQDFAD